MQNFRLFTNYFMDIRVGDLRISILGTLDFRNIGRTRDKLYRQHVNIYQRRVNIYFLMFGIVYNLGLLCCGCHVGRKKKRQAIVG